MEQSRWKSPVFWGTVATQAIALGQLLGIWAKLGLDAGYVGDVVAAVIGLAAIIFGAANNPTNKTGF
jgi:uncharacterized membrane protein